MPQESSLANPHETVNDFKEEHVLTNNKQL